MAIDYIIYNNGLIVQSSVILVPVLDACLQEAGTPVLGPVWISCGGGFSPAGACKFLEDIILHLRKSIKDTKYHKNQVHVYSRNYGWSTCW